MFWHTICGSWQIAAWRMPCPQPLSLTCSPAKVELLVVMRGTNNDFLVRKICGKEHWSMEEAMMMNVCAWLEDEERGMNLKKGQRTLKSNNNRKQRKKWRVERQKPRKKRLMTIREQVYKRKLKKNPENETWTITSIKCPSDINIEGHSQDFGDHQHSGAIDSTMKCYYFGCVLQWSAILCNANSGQGLLRPTIACYWQLFQLLPYMNTIVWVMR